MRERVPESFCPDFPTLVDALRWWGETAPDRPALAFLSDGENETTRFTYAELDREARKTAAGLRRFAEPGNRAVLCYPPGLDFVVAYLGCLYAGVIAVPLFAPRNARHLDRLSAIVTDSQALVALTNSATVRGFRKKKTASMIEMPWLIV